MPYTVEATSKTPAFIIYLIDCSKSMDLALGGAPKIQHVNDAMKQVFRRMIQRSTKGEIIAARYRVAIIAYSDQPFDCLGGIKSIKELAALGVPSFNTLGSTDTAAAFIYARDLLKQELPLLTGHPAPMICHLTDGEYTGADPEPVVHEILQMSNDDGAVLVENIFIGENLTHQPVADTEGWLGIFDAAELTSAYAKKLFSLSSPLPDSYAAMIQSENYSLKPGCRMIIPGTSKDLIELAFAMSGATPTV